MNESEIFQAAIKLTPELRQKFIDAACAGDQQLHRDVKSLLHEFEEMGSFIDRPAERALPTDLYQPISESPGTTIGPYKLMEQIGEGGFGLVFVAEQQQPVRRKVALKIIKPGMDTREVIARFEAERQALALMDHPNIARVFDAGTTESGRPYFVMELVKGVPITEYCDQQQLTARERLELFLSVCQAVQHAHTKGIIHRDIKPSNILVAPHDGIPVIKVIDFGVAKAIGQQLTDKTIYTRFTQMIGTPLYMSPEQAEINALDVDTRSDVYSLGVLLYELLTGTTPIDRQRLAQAAFDEIRRIIKEEDPPKPSTRLSTMGETLSSVSNCRNIEPSKLSALVKGDLDWIVMKALEKDRSRRYETATSFATDVRRFLAEEAIEARPPSSWYRFQKAARRNRVAIATATLLSISLLIGLAGTTWQAYRASQSARVALESARLALESEKKAIEERDAKEKALENEAEQRTIAEVAQQKAQQEGDAAKQAREELRKSLYAASMSLIPSAWEADNVSRVHELLNEQIPKPGEKDLRHFEWHYWYRESHGASRSWKLGDSPESYVLSEDGSRIVGWSSTVLLPSQDDQTKVGNNDATIRVLDVATERELHSFRIRAQDMFSKESIQETSRLQISNLSSNRDASRIGVVFSLITPTVRETRMEPPSAMVNSQMARTNHKTVVFETQNQKSIFSKGIDSSRTSISPDGKRLITCESVATTSGSDQRLPRIKFKIWDLDLPDKEPVELIAKDPAKHALAPSDPKFSPDGLRLVMLNRAGDAMPLPNSIKLWNTITGEEQLNHPLSDSKSSEAANTVTEAVFSPDGKVLATAVIKSPKDLGLGNNAGREVCVELWDCTNPGELKPLKSDGGISMGNTMLPRKIGLTFSSDGERLFAWNEDGNTGSLIDIASGSVLQKIKTLSNIRSIVFSKDGKQVTTVAGNNADAFGRRGRMTNAIMEVWNLAPPIEIKSVPSFRSPNGLVVWSPTKHRQAAYKSGLAGGQVRSEIETDFNVHISDSNGKEILQFKEHSTPVSFLSFSPDGQSIISHSFGSLNETETFLWEADTGKVRWSFKSGPREKEANTSRFNSIDSFTAIYSPDGKWVALPEERGQRIVDSSDLKEHFRVDTKHKLYFSPDSQKLVSFQPSDEAPIVSSAGQLQEFEMKIWDVQTGHCSAKQLLNYPEGRISQTRIWSTYRAIFSPDSRLCIPQGSFSLGSPNCIDIYNLTSGEALVRIQVTKERENNGTNRSPSGRSIIFSPDGDKLLVLDGRLQSVIGMRNSTSVWETSTGKLLYRLDENQASIQSAAFSTDGERLAVVSTHPDRGEVKILDTATGREMLKLKLSTQERFRGGSISFGPDNKLLKVQHAGTSPADRSMGLLEVVWDVTPNHQP